MGVLMIAALFVRADGPYSTRPGVDHWSVDRDATTYAGPHRVIAHPPCARWGRFWWTDGSQVPGNDGGLFESALASVRRWGGVLEHPAGSLAWPAFGLLAPTGNGWTRSMFRPREWTCHVEQGMYGHKAPKPTWLLWVGDGEPPPLRWGQCAHGRGVLGGGKTRQSTCTRMSKRQRELTPEAFADELVRLAEFGR